MTKMTQNEVKQMAEAYSMVISQPVELVQRRVGSKEVIQYAIFVGTEQRYLGSLRGAWEWFCEASAIIEQVQGLK